MNEVPPILIVDDQAKLLRLVTELMNRLGFPEVDGVSDGPLALERMRERKYGLVIADLDMEPMDGIQLLREIRADDGLMNTPFILTETSFSFEDINLAHLAGADAFILKPFDLALLKTKLKQVLNGRPRKRETPVTPVSSLSIDFPMLGKL
ncbi:MULTISPECIES: response regulator [Methylobacterium]|jgi:CheY-like chemotaxis protein|uniref:Regulator of RpoS n=1 Tax=Methylobacterium isbiliense TaxID=315478 RepID=A0ABQ4SCM4_9HYPH|nr:MULTISPECIES: response regulator [Methylobacterium]MBY0299765.1 response regulator [Methylobacterium sp.]MDN3627074.1 response regulator [Methylobacterium isbiliense]GJE00289.1 Regulator of RpoS [Methylobacterium isbiliense]